jgi:hypothetical protein
MREHHTRVSAEKTATAQASIGGGGPWQLLRVPPVGPRLPHGWALKDANKLHSGTERSGARAGIRQPGFEADAMKGENRWRHQ